MTVKQIKEALSKFPDDANVTAWFGELENLQVVEVNTPERMGTGPILWIEEV